MRHNSFNQVHKGLRALLFETAIKIQQCNFADTPAGEKVLQELEQVLLLFESHAHNEDHFFNEPLEEVNKEVARLFEKEHEEDHRLALVLETLIKAWRKANGREERLTIGQQMMYAFHEFIAFNLNHMNKEETLLNQVLWETYTDDQIRATEQQLVQSIAPDKMIQYAQWMIRGINAGEMIHWMRELAVSAPKPVYDQLYAMAREEWGTRWKEVEEALHPQAIL